MPFAFCDAPPEITRETYLHAIPEEQRRAVESVERLVFGPKWTQVRARLVHASGRQLHYQFGLLLE